MSRFNEKITKGKLKPDTRNLAGGEAFSLSPEMEFATMILTSMIDKKFYESGEERLKRVDNLLTKIDPLFAAKAAVYTRRVMGLRSISHYVAAKLVPLVKGKDYAKYFFAAIVERPDDMSEIIGALQGVTGQDKIRGAARSHALRKGFTKAFEKFDAYQFGKYQGKTKSISLSDIVRIFHPKNTSGVIVNRNELIKVLTNQLGATEKSKNEAKATKLRARLNGVKIGEPSETIVIDSLEALQLGLLKSETYQKDLVQAGHKAAEVFKETGDESKAAEVQATMNREAWGDFLTDAKTPFFALVKNIRNILNQAPDLVPLACEKVSDRASIRRSLIMPHEYLTALRVINELPSSSYPRQIIVALSKGLDYAFENVPTFDGETLVVLDESGSMTMEVFGEKTGIGKTPADIGALFAAALCKKNSCDLLTFDTSARYRKYNPMDSINTIKSGLSFKGGGTAVGSVFLTANKKYDRIIIFSDDESWSGGSVMAAFNEYKRKFSADPYVYAWDLCGYGTSQLPESKITKLAGFKSDLFELIGNGEANPKALIDAINQINFTDYLGKRPKKKSAKTA